MSEPRGNCPNSIALHTTVMSLLEYEKGLCRFITIEHIYLIIQYSRKIKTFRLCFCTNCKLTDYDNNDETFWGFEKEIFATISPNFVVNFLAFENFQSSDLIEDFRFVETDQIMYYYIRSPNMLKINIAQF